MLSMKEKAFIGVFVTFVSLLAVNFLIPPVLTYEVRLTIKPPFNQFIVPAKKPFNVTCHGLLDANDRELSSMRWLDTKGNAISEGVPGVKKNGKNSLMLLFTNPKVEESGVYKCKAVYNNAHILEKSVRIVFYGDKPTFDKMYENITAEEGEILEISCVAYGAEPLTYEWYQYEDRISEDTNASMFVSNSGNGSTLIIKNVSARDEGMYTCTASNEHGLSSKVYQLTVFPSSENETTLIDSVQIRNITSNSVNFVVKIIDSAEFIEVKYKEIREDKQYIQKFDYGSEIQVKGLIPAGSYQFSFRTSASNRGGWSEWYGVKLLPAPPEIIIQNLEGRNVKLQWFVSTDDRIRGTIDRYELKYYGMSMRSGGNEFEPWSCAITIQIPACFGSSYTIANLSQKQYYEIQLKAHTEAGFGEPCTQKIYVS